MRGSVALFLSSLASEDTQYLRPSRLGLLSWASACSQDFQILSVPPHREHMEQ